MEDLETEVVRTASLQGPLPTRVNRGDSPSGGPGDSGKWHGPLRYKVHAPRGSRDEILLVEYLETEVARTASLQGPHPTRVNRGDAPRAGLEYSVVSYYP